MHNSPINAPINGPIKVFIADMHKKLSKKFYILKLMNIFTMTFDGSFEKSSNCNLM